jgi:hypothetical protein
MKNTIEMASYGIIYVPNVMKIGSGIHAILRSSLRYLSCYNFGITDRGDLLITLLRQAQMP